MRFVFWNNYDLKGYDRIVYTIVELKSQYGSAPKTEYGSEIPYLDTVWWGWLVFQDEHRAGDVI